MVRIVGFVVAHVRLILTARFAHGAFADAVCGVHGIIHVDARCR